MMCNLLRGPIVATAFVLCVAATTLAAPTVFFDRDDNTALMTSYPNSQAKFNQFTATLNSFGVDTIDGIDTAVPPFGFNPTLSFGATGISAATQGTLAVAAPTFAIGSQALVEPEAFSPTPPGNTIFTFNQYITAFGAFVIQGGDMTNSNPTTFRLRDTATSAFVDVPIQIGPGWGTNNVFFLGVTDTVPFNEVQIIETIDATDGMLYDNIVAGNIPEPGAMVLLFIGGAGALFRATRVRRG